MDASRLPAAAAAVLLAFSASPAVGNGDEETVISNTRTAYASALALRDGISLDDAQTALLAFEEELGKSEDTAKSRWPRPRWIWTAPSRY